jgi:hypothetical protein
MRSVRPARLITVEPTRGALHHGRVCAALAEAGTRIVFPSIEKKYGRSIAEWQQIITDCGLEKHMAIVGYLKSEHGMGHGHANALVGWTLAGNVASA